MPRLLSRLSGALAVLAHLIALSVQTNTGALATTMSGVLAVQKMEQLRGDVAAASFGGSLQSDATGFSDFLDAGGAAVAGGAEGVSFVRRWAVEQAAFDPTRSRVVRVRVFRVPGRASAAPAWPGYGLDETRLLTLLTARER